MGTSPKSDDAGPPGIDPEAMTMAEAEALQRLRQKFGDLDDDLEGWRTLALKLARQYVPKFANERLRTGDEMYNALRAFSAGSRRRGRSRKWTPKARSAVLGFVDRWKSANTLSDESVKPTDEQALTVLKGRIENLPGIRTLKNQLAFARKERKAQRNANP